MVSRALSIMVHAETKIGKSTLANTAPAPRLLMDAEAAYRFLPDRPGTRKIFWDPMFEAPPTLGQGRIEPRLDSQVYQVDWDTCVVIVREYRTMVRCKDWLIQGMHPFRSGIVDSISEIQTRCKDQLTDGTGEMDFGKWGALLNDMERLVREFRDLTEHPINPLQAVVLTSMTHNENGKWRPYVQGQLKIKMPYFLDVIGFMAVISIPDPEDPTKAPIQMRALGVEPSSIYEAGNRCQGRLPAIVYEPTIPGMIDQVFGPEQELTRA